MRFKNIATKIQNAKPVIDAVIHIGIGLWMLRHAAATADGPLHEEALQLLLEGLRLLLTAVGT